MQQPREPSVSSSLSTIDALCFHYRNIVQVLAKNARYPRVRDCCVLGARFVRLLGGPLAPLQTAPMTLQPKTCGIREQRRHRHTASLPRPPHFNN